MNPKAKFGLQSTYQVGDFVRVYKVALRWKVCKVTAILSEDFLGPRTELTNCHGDRPHPVNVSELRPATPDEIDWFHDHALSHKASLKAEKERDKKLKTEYRKQMAAVEAAMLEYSVPFDSPMWAVFKANPLGCRWVFGCVENGKVRR